MSTETEARADGDLCTYQRVWAILYEDAELPPEIFIGSGAEQAAHARHIQISKGYQCELVTNVAHSASLTRKVEELTRERDDYRQRHARLVRERNLWSRRARTARSYAFRAELQRNKQVERAERAEAQLATAREALGSALSLFEDGMAAKAPYVLVAALASTAPGADGEVSE